MASESLQKCVIACQPFKDGVATLICSGCKRLMAFPSGASRVRCAGCSTITSGFRINCTSCREPLKIYLKDRESKCHSCGYIFTPLTTFKIPGASGTAGIAKLANDKIAAIKIIAQENLSPSAKEGIVAKVNLLKPLSCQVKDWEQALGVSNLVTAMFTYKGDTIDLSLTGKQLGIESGETLSCAKREDGGGSQAGGHIFIQASFSQPTNCAYCKKFIWGLFNQGKRCAQCSAPIHHRCASQFTQICEAALRQSIGLSIAQLGNEDEDMDDNDEPMEGQPIQKEDVAEWEALLSETVCPENDSACMSIFDKFEEFTNEDIDRLWKKYDRDGNGELDHAEMRLLVLDMLGKKSDGQCTVVEQELENLIQRITTAMDTSRDGLVQWDEFHSFYKAQLDSSFLRSLQGVPLSIEAINELWYHYDADNSGSLEADELLKLLHDCAMLHKASDEKKQAMKAYRGKLDSLIGPAAKVTWEEFCSQILPMIQPMISGGEVCEEDQL